MIFVLLSAAGLILSALPACMFFANLPLFQIASGEETPGSESKTDLSPPTPSISVLIPARNEAAGIAGTVNAVLRSEGVTVEVVVLDDHSSDDTAAIVQQIAQGDHRVRCVPGRPLPKGWNGKQFACCQLADAASHRRLVFLDADVRLGPTALRWLAQRQDERDVSLLSIFPHQQTGTWLEKWLIPLMHWILLGFLPFHRMRSSTHPAYAAGCGQLFITIADEYQRAGTHAAIRGSRHDGVKLPRAFREAGMRTDVLDGSEVAQCRMYHSGGEVIRGVLKNAVEGIAHPKLILPFSVLLLGGAVLPWLTLFASLARESTAGIVLSLAAIGVSYAPRLAAVRRLRQSTGGALCHPLAIALFVTLQWIALGQSLIGWQVRWRGRA